MTILHFQIAIFSFPISVLTFLLERSLVFHLSVVIELLTGNVVTLERTAKLVANSLSGFMTMKGVPMIFIRDKLTYEEVRNRFEKEGYRLLSTEYKNAKSNLNVLCPHGHEWRTNISNFDFGRRCSTCSRKKKYTLDEARYAFAKVGYHVQDSIYMNGKTPIKVTCANGHQTAISLNNFLKSRRCGFCRWINFREARMKKLEMKAMSEQGLPRCEVGCPISVSSELSSVPDGLVRQEWLDKIDGMRKSLRSTKRRIYREQ